jgi:hypothetical protein
VQSHAIHPVIGDGGTISNIAHMDLVSSALAAAQLGQHALVCCKQTLPGILHKHT